MISVNDLIDNAFHRVGIVGDGESVSPTQSAAGLKDLQSLIAELNTENYLLENYQTFDCYAANKIKFAVKPESWFELDTVQELDDKVRGNLVEVGEIYKIKSDGTFYVIRGDHLKYTDAAFQAYMREYWPTFFVDAIPDRAIGVARKVGASYKQLFPADKMAIDAQVKGHLATLYSCETEWIDVQYPHEANDPNYEPYTVEYFVIEFDSNQSSFFRVTILKGIKEIKIDDKLPVSSKYESMIEDGLCVKLCQRYKYLEMKEDFNTDFEAAKTMISRINSSNRPMIYSQYGNNDYNSNYWNLFGGNFMG